MNIVTYLLKECQLDVQEKDSYGRTCLHWTCENGNVNILRALSHYQFGLSHKDFSGKTPLQLAQKKGVFIELVRLGANPADEYKNLFQSMSEPSISLFIVGSPSAGKTTLVEALTNESSGLRALLDRVQNVSTEAQTAGIIPTVFESKIYGRVTFFDLAGQKQYYASHAAVLQKSISSAPPIIFLVIKLHQSEEEIRQNLLYWFHFLENLFKDDYTEAITRPHLFIIGSHADQPQALPKRLWTRLFGQVESKFLRLIGFVALDCRKAQSTGIAHLRQSLRTSCDTLRLEANVEFRCRCLLVLLIDKFRERSALYLHEILTTIRNLSQASKADTIQPYHFIPYSPSTVSSFCDTLNARGDIFFFKNEVNIENSLIILKKDALLHEVLGTVFAPQEFKQYQQLSSSTGVVPLSKLVKHFTDHDTEVLVQFLCYLEFCHEVDDPEVLAIICKEYEGKSTTTTDERYLFFPSLVTIALPDREQVQGTDSEYRYCCGWMLQCADPNQFFTPRFLQVILLRLAFSFALAPSNPTVNEEIPVLKRKCSVWTNGIHWVNDDGVYTLFEVDEWSQSLTVIMRCLEGSEMESVWIRSAVIQKVLAALHDFCPRVPTLEYFIHPRDIQYPLKSQEQVKFFSIKEIATSVVKGKRAVVNDSQDMISITELLYFEPYTDLGRTVLLELFDEQNPVYNQEQLSDHFVYEIANKTENKFNHFKKMLTLPLYSDQFPISHCSPTPAHAMVHLLLGWREGSEGTRHCLRSNMDVFSVFAGRNPLKMVGIGFDTCASKTVAPITTTAATPYSATTPKENTNDSVSVKVESKAAAIQKESEPSISLHLKTAIEEMNNSTLGIDSLYDVNKEVAGVADWFHLGLSLGLEYTTLEKNGKNNHGDVDCCMTDMLAAWLQGQGTSTPSWRALVDGLASHGVNKKDIATKVAMAHAMNAEIDQSSDECAYSDVDSSALDSSSLYAIAENVLTLSKQWFHLGLALNLSYHTLETIKADYPGDSQRCMTEMLTAWLKCVDMVHEGGVPNWKTLVRALNSPLVRKPEVANMVATAHKQ